MGNQSQDEVFLAAQEAVGAHRDSQGKIYDPYHLNAFTFCKKYVRVLKFLHLVSLKFWYFLYNCKHSDKYVCF